MTYALVVVLFLQGVFPVGRAVAARDLSYEECAALAARIVGATCVPEMET